MDSREFVRLAKHETVDGTVKIMIHRLKTPRTAKPVPDRQTDGVVVASFHTWISERTSKEQRQAALFASLDSEGRDMLQTLLEECAELSAASLFTLIEGVGGGYEGVCEIVHVFGDEERTVLNPRNAEKLHDLFSDICEEERIRKV